MTVGKSRKNANARPELFISNGEWVKKIGNKIRETKQELEQVKNNEADKTKKIERLKSKLKELQKVKETLEKSTQTDSFTTADKETQTELTKEVIVELLQKLEVKK